MSANEHDHDADQGQHANVDAADLGHGHDQGHQEGHSSDVGHGHGANHDAADLGHGHDRGHQEGHGSDAGHGHGANHDGADLGYGYDAGRGRHGDDDHRLGHDFGHRRYRDDDHRHGQDFGHRRHGDDHRLGQDFGHHDDQSRHANYDDADLGHGHGHGSVGDEEDHHQHGHGHDHGHEHGAEVGVLGRLRHVLQPHSHDAADSVDAALVSSTDGIRAVKLSLIGLGITAALQLVVAVASGSVAVLADTIHNFADASTAIPLWLAFWIGRKPANDRYTYGYGRAEDLAGVFVLLTIIGSAAVAFWESLQKLVHPTPVDHLGWVAVAGLAGFFGNELVAQYRIRVGQRIGSVALVADGYHARTDGLTSLAVLIGAAGVWLGFQIADPLVGLLITVAILIVLKDAALQMWRRLMDAVDPGLVEQAAAAAGQAEGVQGVSAVRARWIGHAIHAEALIVADAELSLGQAHEVAERARHNMLHAVPKLSTVTVHVDPCGHDGRDHHADLAHHDRPRATAAGGQGSGPGPDQEPAGTGDPASLT